MRQILLTFLVLCTMSFSVSAQIFNPVKWSHEAKSLGNDQFELIYTAKIDDGWSIYSQYLESDDGPVKTSFEYDKGAHFTLDGKNVETGGKKEAYDAIFDMQLIKFKKNGIFTQKISVNDYSKPITGYLEFMTCDDTKCLPPKTIDFEFKLSAEKKGTGKTGAIDTKKATQAAKDVVNIEKPKKAIAKVEQSVKETTKKAVEKVESVKQEIKQPIDKISKTKEEKAATQGSGELNASNAGSGLGSLKVDLGGNDDSASNGFNNGGLLDPVKWSGKLEKKGEGDYVAEFTAKIQDKWAIYSQYLESDDGPNPTVFTFEEADHYSLVGKNEESGGYKKAFDPVFDMTVAKFKKNAIFRQQLKVEDPTKPIVGYLEFMTCDETKCLPPKYVDFKFTPANNTFLVGKEATATAENVAASASTAKIVGNEIDQAIPAIQATYKEPIGDCGEEDVATGNSLLWTFILGFLGGLIALLTPCVWPMIPLTVSFFTKGSKDRASGIKNGLIYGISIIAIYVGLGLLITTLFGPTALNALSTNWIANVAFFVMFIAFAISFFGYYEITLPASWANKSDAMAEKGGHLGTFFMAATLSLVSFSCTGPIIGSALVTAASNALGPAIVMLGFSSALALPFGLFAAFPAWLNTLPKSGSWMTSVKVVLGFVELALALKFLSVADMTMHWGILKYETFMVLWIILAFACAAYLFGYIRFAHDSKLMKLSPARGGIGVLFLAFGIYLCTGFMTNDKGTYNSLSLMSGLAPPAGYNILKGKGALDASIKEEYSTYTKCANNLNCFKDYYEGMSFAKKRNLPVLLDFTGHGCVNCRKTEEHIWVDENVWDKLNNEFVLISLYVDDREKLEETLVSKNTQERLRNIGNKWADFQIVNFQQNSQPLYVMVTPEEEVLAAPRGFKEGTQDYLEFLECGLETFNGMKKDGKIGMK